MIDWTKPVRFKPSGDVLRVLATDAGVKNDDPPVVVMWPNGVIGRLTVDGRYYSDYAVVVENVPPPKETQTFELVMHRPRKGGRITVSKYEPGWILSYANEVLARKTVTITEGEGM